MQIMHIIHDRKDIYFLNTMRLIDSGVMSVHVDTLIFMLTHQFLQLLLCKTIKSTNDFSVYSPSRMNHRLLFSPLWSSWCIVIIIITTICNKNTICCWFISRFIDYFFYVFLFFCENKIDALPFGFSSFMVFFLIMRSGFSNINFKSKSFHCFI